MFHFLSDLNEKQREAVQTTEGPLLIIAGAGSGKTRALTYRIAYLIKEKNIDPRHILAVTFTNKAALEMKARLVKLLSPHETPSSAILKFSGRLEPVSWNRSYNFLPTVGTFHALCVQILRKHIHLLHYENTFNIYDAADQKALMKTLLEEHKLDEKKFNPVAILSQISGAKNELITPDHYSQMASSYFMQTVATLYTAYEKALHKNSALDFDDLIMKTIGLFQMVPEVLKEYKERFQYISVDEYQDTNHSQYILIKLLSGKHKNLCVIGDEDQSIYSWRGADIRNILEFEKDYPNAKIIKLEQNYRSTQVILDAAHQVIVKNRKRKEKKLWTEKKEGSKIRIWTARNEREEGELIANEIIKRLRSHEFPTYTDFVVLYRTNAQSRVLEEVFMRYGIPYKIVGGIKFYERKEIKDIIAYLKVTQNPQDIMSLIRIVNTPPRNIGEKTLESLQYFANRQNITLFEAIRQVETIDDLSEAKQSTLKNFAKMWKEFFEANSQFSASGVIKTILQRSGYKEFLLADGTPESETRWDNVRELISVASKYDALPPGISLCTFLEEVSLISDLDTIGSSVGSVNFDLEIGGAPRESKDMVSEEKDNAVTLMTLHGAKGLEFPCVFISGLEEGIFPHSRSLFEPEQLEEERRLMYVGITRAKEDIFLLHARQRLLYGEYLAHEASQFLQDIPEELVSRNIATSIIKPISLDGMGRRPVPTEWSTRSTGRDSIDRINDRLIELKDGDKVRHKIWGEGIVVSVTGGIATIAFRDGKVGIKKVALSVAPLEKI